MYKLIRDRLGEDVRSVMAEVSLFGYVCLGVGLCGLFRFVWFVYSCQGLIV